jgi:exopolysaccharide biosynthesis polyprenyl glycosylphosphotransferase
MKIQVDLRAADLLVAPRQNESRENVTMHLPALPINLQLPGRDGDAKFFPLGRILPANRGLGISSRRWMQWRCVTIDLCCLLFSFGVIASLHFTSKPPLGPAHSVYYLLFGGMSLAFGFAHGLYEMTQTRSFGEEASAVVKSVCWATILLTVVLSMLGVKEVSSTVLTGCALSSILLLIAWRLGQRRLIERRVDAGLNARHVLIIGAGKTGRAVADALARHKQLGMTVCGFLDENHAGEPSILGGIEDLPRVARVVFADEIIVTNPGERDLAQKAIALARANHLDVKVVPELFGTLGRQPVIEYLGDLPVMALHEEPIPAAGLFVKRCLDVVGAGLALVALSPLLIAAAIAIKVDSRGPALYGSVRLGRKGRKFICLKFRTMVTNADELKESLRKTSEDGPFFQMCEDPRVTRIGGFLRKYSIDELPQLLNVLKGDMSLVGPRPHPLDDWEAVTTELESMASGNGHELQHFQLLDVTPGITGLRQITDRRCPSIERNLALDLEYIENWSVRMDLQILFKTVAVVLAGSGA